MIELEAKGCEKFLSLLLWPGQWLGSLRSRFRQQIHQSVAVPRLQRISHASLEFCNSNWQTEEKESTARTTQEACFNRGGGVDKNFFANAAGQNFRRRR